MTFEVAGTLSVMEQRIRETVAAIPSGCVASYGQVAELAGWPRRARFVAQALRRAPPKLQLPWHRVLRADGRIAFPRDSAPFREQRRRLRAEGVTIVGGRVNMTSYRWKPELAELLFQPPFE